MSEILYTFVIFPIVQVIELCYLFVFRVFHNPGISLLGVSVAVSTLTLPLYFRAEKWQAAERELQKRLAPKLAKIKAAFSGDERYMILQAYYRQNHYHPAFALRNSLGILIQIPFFIAAYSYISHLEVLKGVSFLFIKDLGAPDGLLGFNVLPLVMTLVNCISGAIYTKGFPRREKIQLYGMALVFLALLYNSPAALVIYWTTNNIFSFFKNILEKTKHARLLVYSALCICAAMLDVYVLFIHPGYILKRIIIALAVSIIFFLPIFKRLFALLKRKIQSPGLGELPPDSVKLYALSAVLLFLLAGLVIPSSLVASSTVEFSFLEQYTSPFPLIVNTLIQSAGIFLFWPFCIYFLFKPNIKKILTALMLFLCFCSFINTFLFSGEYGFLTNTLIFSNLGTGFSNILVVLLNFAALVFVIPLLFFLLASPRRRSLLFSIEIIAAAALLSFGIINIAAINREFNALPGQEASAQKSLSPVFTLSKTGKNVVIIMLDRAISGFVPYLFNEKPELNEMWNGFTWYPNCVSFAGWTLYGVPSLMGGYEYTPLAMQENPKPLAEKHNESLLLLPVIFANAGYNSVITDPIYANYAFSPDLRIFEPYKNIYAANIKAAYASHWMKDHPETQIISVSALLKERLFRFSFFKIAPVILRTFIYDRGDWLTVNNQGLKEDRNELTVNMIGKYASLDYLPEITKIDSGKAQNSGNLAIMLNELTHDPVFLEAPDYLPRTEITDKGNGPFANNPHYHVNMAAFLLLGKWFDFLMNEQVYDNTKIIIVSDHGYNIDTGSNSFVLPDRNRVEKYISLLMIKDFNAKGALSINDSFMTQADVPLLALNGIIDNPVNPFSGKPLYTEKETGAIITTSNKFYPTNHGKYRFNIDRNEWLHVHDTIFNPANWEKVEIVDFLYKKTQILPKFP